MFKPNNIFEKYSLTTVVLAPLLPSIVGSVFNIWYNFSNIQPLLTDNQLSRFWSAVNIYNGITYPLLVGGYIVWVMSLGSTQAKLRSGTSVSSDELLRSQQKVIHLPWGIIVISCIGWFLCIPVFLLVLHASPEPLHPHVSLHLPISFLIAGLIAITQSIFIAEICSIRLLYPTFFPNGGAVSATGASTFSLASKGVIWAISTVVCPIISLLLLFIAPVESQNQEWFTLFAIAVSGVAILFGSVSAYLLGRLVTKPVRLLRQAAQRVGNGDLTARVDLARADDFGPLIDEFNRMVVGLNEKTTLEETFGRHVGAKAAKQILAQQAGPVGNSQTISVMFTDVRDFTTRCSEMSPTEAVAVLNLFLSAMVDIVEEHEGMVNKFLGDGFMALFGAGQIDSNHADDAVRAGRDMVRKMDDINEQLQQQGIEALKIGIGIHTGPAVVGSIGSTKRLEYTAIGDTVNVASRVESLTKRVGTTMLITAETYDALNSDRDFDALPPQAVKGKAIPIQVFAPR